MIPFIDHTIKVVDLEPFDIIQAESNLKPREKTIGQTAFTAAAAAAAAAAAPP